MSFAGVSLVADGRLVQPPSGVPDTYSSTAGSGSDGWWYHQLVVQDYSRVKDMPTGVHITGRSFTAGGYRWALKFYPNGARVEDAGFISVYLVLDEDVARPVKVHRQFSLVRQVHMQELARIRATDAFDFSRRGIGSGRRRFVKKEDLEKSEHLKGDLFTIRCDFIIAEAAATFVKVGTDVTFEVGHEMFDAHRCVLATRSAVFMAELFGPTREGIPTASAIQIQDMEPNVFKALLSFIYTDSMPKMEAEGEAAAQVMWLRHLHAGADRYDLPRLKLMCEERLCGLVDLSSVTPILGLAAQHYCSRLKKACLEFLKVQSTKDLRGVMATSEWEHIAATDPSVMSELIANLILKA
ncbi:BTB/POZ and MATH domain-containing protein 3-like [Aegilops tauschii subsp. strangulata]|uniref:BTB/POZ and MATH domain-containing protein 3-like n=1 Tax=Aegilops tauschii subsp. strangulata TaxID=200361 RepID=UPI00098BBCA3|nr:BTB/POZ and MATH domain-containing protein 3-like [Aegilops tauschii subsp. strangulata]